MAVPGHIVERRRQSSFWMNLLSLIFIAVLSGGVWRLEVELHGWEGLIWIGYFHWAVPAGAALFVAWALWANRGLPLARVLRLFGLLVAASAGTAYATCRALELTYNWWTLIPFGSWAPLVCSLADVWWYAIPTVWAIVALAAGLRVGLARFLLANLLYVAATPLAVVLLSFTRIEGERDSIHAIKTGFIIPFLMLAVGILFLPAGRRKVVERSNSERRTSR